MSNVAIDWNRYMNGLLGKANIAADNFSFPGKEELSGMGMPSGKYVDLSLGASESPYVAPANGYFLLILHRNNKQGEVYIGDGSGKEWSSTIPSTIGNYVQMTVPCLKGHVRKIVYSSGFTVHTFRFIYAEGSKN